MNRSGNHTASDREYVRAAILESIIEAQLMASVLNDRQIPHRIQSYHDTAYDGLFQVQKGWGEIRVPVDFLDLTKNILDSIRASGSSS